MTGASIKNRWLVAYDDTPHSRLALSEACRALMRRADAHVEVFSAVPLLLPTQSAPLVLHADADGLTKAQRELSKATLAHLEDVAAQAHAEHPSVKVHASSSIGDVGPAVLHAAERVDASTIVVGTHGRRGIARVLLGSEAERILRDSGLPVLVVRPGTLNRPAFPPSRLVVAMGLVDDDDPADDAALTAALNLAKEHGASLALAHVMSPTIVPEVSFRMGSAAHDALQQTRQELKTAIEARMEARLAALQGESVDVVGEIVAGSDVGEGVGRYAAEQGADVVITCAHRKIGLERFLGSDAHRILRVAPCSVLVVPPV